MHLTTLFETKQNEKKKYENEATEQNKEFNFEIFFFLNANNFVFSETSNVLVSYQDKKTIY